MKIDMKTLEDSVKKEMQALANNALKFDGKFSYDNKQYLASIKDRSIEISLFNPIEYKMNNLSPEKKEEFKTKVNLAKQSSDPQDRKFQVDDILVEVKEPISGSFMIYTTLAPNTGSVS